MDTMKKTLVLLTFMLGLALGAIAQEPLTFANLPLVSTPTLLPNGYGQLNWSNFFYVDPWEWSGAGPGYKLGPDRGDVAFIGGKSCIYEYQKGVTLQPEACYGSISSAGGATSFQPISAMAAGGFGPVAVTVTAYNNGQYVGSSIYSLTAAPQNINFPSSWGAITQMVIQTDASGDFVLFNLNVYLLGG